ncbi:MAG TPA: hypothetical protein VGB37_04760, partial [Candidatus Lokiarchaeia archaeon]
FFFSSIVVVAVVSEAVLSAEVLATEAGVCCSVDFPESPFFEQDEIDNNTNEEINPMVKKIAIILFSFITLLFLLKIYSINLFV